ncbi:MAG: lytic transglycosylase domain-containing protein, partial [Thermoanaerobaculia bacterium]
MKRYAVLPLLAVTAMACASTSRELQQRPLPATSASPRIEAAIDAAEYHHALEEAYAQIVARTSGNAKAPVIDADAILSMPVPEHPTIAGAVDYFSNELRDQIQRSLYRSARYRPMIEPVLDANRLPRGLAYLPVIESAYVPTLTSKAGAHGIWQFMPGTGREMGLEINWWLDERADPEAATRAAAKYLRYLFDEFSDWPLALAAYNAGPGRIRRALNETGSSTYWELVDKAAIPRETRGYVPTFYATLVIVSDPASYGFTLTEPESQNFARVEI